MKYELLAVFGLVFCLVIVGLEYLLHYRLAEKQDEKEVNNRRITQRVKIRVEGIIYAPTDSSRKSEIEALAKDIDNDFEAYERSIAIIEETRDRFDKDDDEYKDLDQLIDRVIETVNPVGIYASMLDSNDIYHKSYALRRLSDLGADEYHDVMVEYSKDKHRDLAYNAAMALAKLGDAENVAAFILSIENDRLYSGRIINEFFDDFNGDRAELARLLFENCNSYMTSNIIKAITPYKLEEFHQMFVENSASKDFQLKVASVKALAAFGWPEDEQLLQMAAQDKEWVIRASAVRGLALLDTPTALESVKTALRDKEWWVRQTAASALTSMDISPTDLEDVLGGYDRYAADAVKSVLFKTVDSPI